MKILSQIFTAIQGYLFSYIEGEWGPLTEKQKQVIQTLELIPLAEFVKETNKIRGRTQADRRKLARAFVVKAIYNLTTTRQLIDLVQGAEFVAGRPPRKFLMSPPSHEPSKSSL